MKVLLYFEDEKKISKSGIGRALKHQIAALTSQGIEYTLSTKDQFDIAHINTYFPKSKLLLKKCRRKGIPVIVHGHSTIEDFKNSFRLWKLMALWFNPNLLSFYRQADMIITPTLYSKKCIDNYHLNTPTYVCSNGINPSDYLYDEEKVQKFKEYFHLKAGQKVVMGVGFPFNRKGIKDFFEVARKFPEITFIWFGYLQRILTSIDVLKAIKHRPKNVIMPGYISNDIIKGAYHYAACLFFPSYEETEGIVTLEALASSCPLLIRDIGVYSDWLSDNVNCYKAKNNDEFIQKLNYLLTHDNSRIIANGLKVVETRKLENVGVRLKKLYLKALNK